MRGLMVLSVLMAMGGNSGEGRKAPESSFNQLS